MPYQKALIYLSLVFLFSCTAHQSTVNQSSVEKPLSISGKSINFIVVGDWGRKGNHNQKEVANQMGKTAENRDVNFIISTGDNFYFNGVKSTFDPDWKKSFENVYTAKSLYVPWYVVFGNHDYMGKVDAQLKYSQKSERWKTPARYYSFEQQIPGTSENVLFAFIDTNPFDKSLPGKIHSDVKKQDTLAQKKWLIETLEKSNSKWKIVIGHHPLFTTGARKGTMNDIRDSFQPIFEKYQIDAYFAGHEHDLQHQKPEGHTHYFVSGAGSKIRPVGSDPNMTRFAISDHGFMLAVVDKSGLHIEVINYQGKLLYNVDLQK